MEQGVRRQLEAYKSNGGRSVSAYGSLAGELYAKGDFSGAVVNERVIEGVVDKKIRVLSFTGSFVTTSEFIFKDGDGLGAVGISPIYHGRANTSISEKCSEGLFETSASNALGISHTDGVGIRLTYILVD